VLTAAPAPLRHGSRVIISGGNDTTVRVWRLDDGTPVGEPLRGHYGAVNAVAAGTLPDGTPVIISGGSFGDQTVRVWRLADGTPASEPMALLQSIRGVAVHGNVIVAAVGTGLIACQPTLAQPIR